MTCFKPSAVTRVAGPGFEFQTKRKDQEGACLEFSSRPEVEMPCPCFLKSDFPRCL